jgi:uncharacterized protein (TIGR00661 family)
MIMKNSRRILFIINGLGMGNSTRCHSIIEKLHDKSYSIDVVTSGNGIDYFRHNMSCINDLMEIRSLFYKKYKGKLSIPSTVLSLPILAVFYTQNIYLLYHILKNKSYDAVIIDSDYTIMFLRKIFSIPVFAINNADIVVNEIRKMGKIPINIFMQYLVEKLDYWFHLLFVDFVLSPAILESYNNSPDSNYHIHHFPPLIRKGLTVTDNKKAVENILVMLSGSQFATDVSFIENKPNFPNITITVIGRNGASSEKVKYLGKVFNNISQLNMADILIINAGFSAVSEAVLLRKPCVVIPIDNHAEQYVNAQIMERKGYAVIAGLDNVWEKTDEIITNYDAYRQNLDRKVLPLNGSFLVAEMIDARIESM